MIPSTMSEIERFVPIPKIVRNPLYLPTKERLLALKCMESFTVQHEKERHYALMVAKRSKVNITTRKLAGGGFRIWRVD